MNLIIKNAKYGIYKSTACDWEAETGCLQFQTPILGHTAKFQANRVYSDMLPKNRQMQVCICEYV